MLWGVGVVFLGILLEVESYGWGVVRIYIASLGVKKQVEILI